jgi:hypothetical protein
MLFPLIAVVLAAQVAPPAETRLMLTGFDRIRVDGPFTVRVVAQPSAVNRIIGDAATIATVKIRVEGQTLVVTSARDDRGRPIVATGPAPVIELRNDRLAAIALRGAGKIEVERTTASRIDLALTGDGTIRVGSLGSETVSATLIGAGSMTLAGKGGQGRFMINGPGTIDADALTIDALQVRSEGSGGGRYRARYTADVTATGAGTVTVAGSPQCRKRGTATIRCG